MPRSEGFTLIELITVVVVIGIVGVLGTQFVVSTMQSYTRSVERGKLIGYGRLALERMNREIRLALPASVRVTNGSQCVEYLPVVAGGNYIDSLPDQSNLAAGVSAFETSTYQLGLGTARYVYVSPLSSAEVYGGGVAGIALSGAEDHGDTILSLSAAHQFLRNSVSKRFYLVDDPEAFCLVGDDLRHFDSYATPSTSAGIPAGNGVLIAEGVSADASPFELSPGTEDRNTTLAINLTFSRSGEGLTLNQQIFIRNVP